MRDSGFDSTGPNLAKSTSGQAGRLNGNPPPDFSFEIFLLDGTPLTHACTSACRMRPFGPLAGTRVRSTPSSRANLRTEGLAWGLAAPSSPASRATGGAATGLGAGADAGAVA